MLFNRCDEPEFRASWLTIQEYIQLAKESLRNAFRTINLPDWKLDKTGSQKGDVVESRHTEQFGKVYRFTGLVNCPAKFLYEEFRDNVDKLPKWNPMILKSEVTKELGPGIDLTYQVTAGVGPGIVSPRDFVSVRRAAALAADGSAAGAAGAEPHCYVSAAVSVDVAAYPPRRDPVRGHNKVGCFCFEPKKVQTPSGKIEHVTVFRWLMCCDVKVKIPQFVQSAALATFMVRYVEHVRALAAAARARRRF